MGTFCLFNDFTTYISGQQKTWKIILRPFQFTLKIWFVLFWNSYLFHYMGTGLRLSVFPISFSLKSLENLTAILNLLCSTNISYWTYQLLFSCNDIYHHHYWPAGIIGEQMPWNWKLDFSMMRFVWRIFVAPIYSLLSLLNGSRKRVYRSIVYILHNKIKTFFCS